MALYWALVALTVLGNNFALAQIVFKSDTGKTAATADGSKDVAKEEPASDSPQTRFLGGIFDSCSGCSSINIQQAQICCQSRSRCCEFVIGATGVGGGSPVFVGPDSFKPPVPFQTQGPFGPLPVPQIGQFLGHRPTSFSGSFGHNQFRPGQFGVGPGFGGIPSHLGGNLHVGPPGHFGGSPGFGKPICPRPNPTKDFLGIRSLQGDAEKQTDQKERVKRQDKKPETEPKKSSDPQARFFGGSSFGPLGPGNFGGFPGGLGHSGSFPVGPGNFGVSPIGFPGSFHGSGSECIDECITNSQCPPQFLCCFNSKNCRQCSTPEYI